MKRLFTLFVAGALTAGVVSLRAHDPVNSKVTWDTDIARLVGARCVTCHAANGRGPMPLTTYAEARPWARAIREEVLTRRMPKWHAARGYGQFANDPSLSPAEIALFVAWVDGGALRSRPRPGRPVNAAPGQPGTEGRAVASAEKSGRSRGTTRLLGCGDRPLAGTLLAVKPILGAGGSAGITAHLPDGRREIVAWIRDFDAALADTYWLRTPLTLPRGSRLIVEAAPPCRVEVTVR